MNGIPVSVKNLTPAEVGEAVGDNLLVSDGTITLSLSNEEVYELSSYLFPDLGSRYTLDTLEIIQKSLEQSVAHAIHKSVTREGNPCLLNVTFSAGTFHVSDTLVELTACGVYS